MGGLLRESDEGKKGGEKKEEEEEIKTGKSAQEENREKRKKFAENRERKRENEKKGKLQGSDSIIMRERRNKNAAKTRKRGRRRLPFSALFYILSKLLGYV